MARLSFCSHAQAVLWLPNPSNRCTPSALIPCFWFVTDHIARNQVRRGK